MKHFNLLKTTLLLCALIVGSLSGWADDASFIPEDFSSQGTSGSGSAISATVDGVTFACNKGYGTTQIRCYSGGKISISSSNTITAISFTFSGSYTGGLETSYTGLSTTSWECTLSSQARITAVKVTYSAAAPTYTITAASNNNSWGSVSLSGNVITATPATGYTYAAPAYSVNPANSATVLQEEDNFTVTPSADTEVTINFAPIPTHTATFSVNGDISQQDYMEGTDIAFPSNPTAIDDKVFMGWVNSSIVGTINDAPSFVSSATMGNSDVTFYAVFATKSGSGDPAWAETPLSEMIASDVFVISNGSYAMTNDNGTGSAPSAVKITVLEGKITSTVADNLKWNVLGNATDGYSFYPNGDSKKWLYCNTTASSGSNNNIRVGTGERKLWIFDNSGYVVTNDNSTDRYLSLYNNSDFRGYISTGNGAFIPKFYKYTSSVSYSEYCTTVVKASVARPEITLAANPFTFSTTATITCTTNGADIKYSYDGTNWSDYSAPLTITETKTIYAKAVLNSDESQVATVTATKNLVEPTVTIDAAGIINTNVFAGTEAGSLSATVTYNDAPVEGAVVAWSVDNDKVATINATTGAVTLVGKGSVTFTATYAGNGDYSEKSATYNMTVIYDDPNAPGTINNPLTVADVNSGSYSGDNYVTGYIVGFFSGKDSNASSSGNSNLALSDTPDEISGANTIAVQLPSGTLRTSWNIDDNNVIGYKVLVYGNITGYFSGKTGVKNTSEITAVSVPVSISAAGWATYCSSNALDFTGITALTAYTASKDGNVVKFNKVTGKVPANEGLLVKGESASVPVCASADPVTNLLVGVTAETVKTANTVFVLMKGSKGIGFYKNTNDFTLRANSAYLPAEAVPTADARAFIALDDETTGIADVKAVKEDAEGMFDLQGRKIAKPTKGLYIVNGKKIAVK